MRICLEEAMSLNLSNQYLNHLSSSDDLLTTYEATRTGFVNLALEKNRRATPFVNEAITLKESASKAKKASDLLKIKGIEAGLLAASGLSNKALSHLSEADKTQAIKQLIKDFLEPAGSKFVEELIFRFLLIRGDTLGGKMRNIGGVLAQKRVMRVFLSCLSMAGIQPLILLQGKTLWIQKPNDDFEIENKIKGIYWKHEGKDRCLINNIKVPIVGTNIDMCVFNTNPKKLDYANPKQYLALGELKGGIDPAGADEHWKTASSALDRIRNAFEKHELFPSIFYIGAAIQKRMAEEIWEHLENETISNAANLTVDAQIVSLCRWICLS